MGCTPGSLPAFAPNMVMGQPPAWPGAYPRQPLGMAPAYAPQNSYPAASQPLSPGWSRPSAPVAAAPVPAPQPARSGSAGFVARGAMPEAPATASFKLPAPEALGIHPATPAPTVLVSADAFDWTLARQQMTSLGVKSFQFDTLPDGSHRFVCNVIGNDGRQQQIEGTGAAEGDAVRLALQRAALWRQGR